MEETDSPHYYICLRHIKKITRHNVCRIWKENCGILCVKEFWNLAKKIESKTPLQATGYQTCSAAEQRGI